MKSFAVAVIAFASGLSACAPTKRTTDMTNVQSLPAPSTLEDMRTVSPALAHYTNTTLLGDLWKRPQLSARDRSIVTLSVLIARNQTAEMPYYVNLALESGLQPTELSEIITHLAFYAGWGNAVSAVAAAKPVFDKRGVTLSDVPPVSAQSLPIDETTEAKRATAVESNFGSVAPGVVHYTTEVLFHDLWLRPGLSPRDRSLATVSALVATGQFAQLTYHLNRAMDNGLTRAQTSEVMTQLAFYTGWPNVFSALPVVKDVLEKRPG